MVALRDPPAFPSPPRPMLADLAKDLLRKQAMFGAWAAQRAFSEFFRAPPGSHHSPEADLVRPLLWPWTAVEGGLRKASKRSLTMA